MCPRSCDEECSFLDTKFLKLFEKFVTCGLHLDYFQKSIFGSYRWAFYFKCHSHFMQFKFSFGRFEACSWYLYVLMCCYELFIAFCTHTCYSAENYWFCDQSKHLIPAKVTQFFARRWPVFFLFGRILPVFKSYGVYMLDQEKQ